MSGLVLGGDPLFNSDVQPFTNAAAQLLSRLDGSIIDPHKGPHRHLGYTRIEWNRGLTHWDFTHPDDLGPAEEFNAKALTGEVTWGQWLKRNIHRDGSVMPIRLTAKMVRDTRGRPKFIRAWIEPWGGDDKITSHPSDSCEFYADLAHSLACGLRNRGSGSSTPRL